MKKASVKQYAQTLLEITDGLEGAELKKAIKRFAAVLVANNQISNLDKIVKAFQTLWNKKAGVIKAELLSARQLDPETLAVLDRHLKKVAKAESLDLTIETDQEIIGGVVIKYGDKIIDASLRSRLRSLREAILN